VPFSANTAYAEYDSGRETGQIPRNQDIEQTIRAYVRWNAMMMVLRANKHTNVGAISRVCVRGTLYEVGYNHFGARPPTKMTAI